MLHLYTPVGDVLTHTGAELGGKLVLLQGRQLVPQRLVDVQLSGWADAVPARRNSYLLVPPGLHMFWLASIVVQKSSTWLQVIGSTLQGPAESLYRQHGAACHLRYPDIYKIIP